MTTRREVLLEALDAWRAEGAIDEDAWNFLRARYQNAPRRDDLDGPLAPAAATTAPHEPRRSFAADAMQFIGGLLVGAAFVALAIYLDLTSNTQPYLLVGLGALLLIPAAVGAFRGLAPGLVEAGLAGGLVPLAVAAGIAASDSDLFIPMLVAAVAVGVTIIRRGEGASVLVAAVVYCVGTAGATLLQNGIMNGAADSVMRWTWLISLLAYMALLLVWRHALWSTISLAFIVAPIAGAFLLVLDLGSFTSQATELIVGAFLSALLVPAILLGSRGLVAGLAAGLTIDAITFASDVGGPGTAVILLLALGGLLVWQAEYVRRYFRRDLAEQL